MRIRSPRLACCAWCWSLGWRPLWQPAIPGRDQSGGIKRQLQAKHQAIKVRAWMARTALSAARMFIWMSFREGSDARIGGRNISPRGAKLSQPRKLAFRCMQVLNGDRTAQNSPACFAGSPSPQLPPVLHRGSPHRQRRRNRHRCLLPNQPVHQADRRSPANPGQRPRRRPRPHAQPRQR